MPDLKTTAARYLAGKQTVATTLSSREIKDYVPAALVDNAAFSARTVYAEHITETYRDIATALEGHTLNPAEIRTRMKLRLKALGYAPSDEDKGTLRDLGSDARTNLIIEMNEASARGYAVWRGQQDETLMTVWPAQELYRGMARAKPRHWMQRWNDARRDLGEGGTSATLAESDNGPFKAVKNDRVWTHPSVNRFGRPWTPFDYRSGMMLRQITASKARADGVLTDANRPRPQRDPMRGVQSASAEGVPEPVLNEWMAPFGDRARLSGGRVHVAPPPSVISEVIDAGFAKFGGRAVFGFVPERHLAAAAKALGKSLPAETAFSLDADEVRHIDRRHGPPRTETGADGKRETLGERDKKQEPVSRERMEGLPADLAAPGEWRLSAPDGKEAGKGSALIFESETGAVVALRVLLKEKTPRLAVASMWVRKTPTR